MDELTTRVSGLLDYGTVDLGYHYPVNSGSIRTLWGRIATTPPAGILPAHPRFWLLIRQQTSPAVERTAAINIGLRAAGGPYYPNWRTGTATITPDVDTPWCCPTAGPWWARTSSCCGWWTSLPRPTICRHTSRPGGRPPTPSSSPASSPEGERQQTEWCPAHGCRPVTVQRAAWV